jgi:hypothetical protein
MSQRLPFNNVPSIFEVPKVIAPAPGRVFHKLTEDSLWELHFWLATNEAAAAAAITPVIAVDGGGALLASQIIESGNGDKIFKIADGIPLRGPMDLAVAWTGAGAQSDPPVAGFGYVSRGAAIRDAEKRFFNPGANIGDQKSSFEGGGLVILVGGNTPQDVQQTTEDRIDEITLRVNSAAPGVDTPNAGFDTTNGGVPSETVVRVAPSLTPVTIFDGVPFRNAGMMQVAVDDTEVDFSWFSGHFVRG